jgi:hypothetical protein
MTRRLALALVLLLALPAGASAHTIKGLVHDARDVVLVQAPGTHASIAADGVTGRPALEARVVEVLDLCKLPALSARRVGAQGAPIVTCRGHDRVADRSTQG